MVARLGVLVLLLIAIFAIHTLKPVSVLDPQPSIFPNPTPKLDSTNRQATIILMGDIMLGRTVMTTSLDKSDAIYPFRHVAEEIKKADVALANLENPITTDCPRRTSGFVFCADPKMIEGLTFAGIDVVSLANNHTLNHGRQGFDETKLHLISKDIDYIGDMNLVKKIINSTVFGFLGFEKSQQSNPALTFTERDLIEQSNKEVDVLIVAMHWGTEYKNTALPGVQKLAKELVELGADVVVGHHPHWVQNNEKINDVPVYYSLGNFVFDQMWSEETKKGLAIKLTFENDKIVKEELLNTYMQDWAQPIFIKE